MTVGDLSHLGDSGKSTISKQIKLLQLGGYTRREILSFAPTIRANSLIAIRTYLDGTPTLSLTPFPHSGGLLPP